MKPAGLLFRSSIGRKFLMAATGLILVGFVTGHLVGNLQIFAHPDKINGYAHFLQSLGPALWAVRLGLLACVLLHVWAAVALALENRAARGPEPYGVSTLLDATFASRYIKHTGLVVLAFILYHLAHFTVGAAQTGSFKSNLLDYSMGGDFHLLGFPLVAKGQAVHDVYSMVFLGFANPVVSLFYIVASACSCICCTASTRCFRPSAAQSSLVVLAPEAGARLQPGLLPGQWRFPARSSAASCSRAPAPPPRRKWRSPSRPPPSPNANLPAMAKLDQGSLRPLAEKWRKHRRSQTHRPANKRKYEIVVVGAGQPVPPRRPRFPSWATG